MVIGDQHLDSGSARRRHSSMARDAVVDGDQQGRGPREGQRHDLGAQAIAEAEPVRHQEVRRKSETAQRAYHERAAGGSVGVEIPDHQYAPGGAVPQQ
jgi:hypothetical protein